MRGALLATNRKNGQRTDGLGCDGAKKKWTVLKFFLSCPVVSFFSDSVGIPAMGEAVEDGEPRQR